MNAFKPAETPFWKKVAFSPILHVTVIFGLVFVTIFFIRQRQKDELRARLEYLKGGPVLVERPLPAQAAASRQANAAELSSETQTANAVSAPDPEKPAKPPAPTAPVVTAAAESPTVPAVALRTAGSVSAATNRPAPNRAVIIYAEIDRGVLNTWMNELRIAGHLRSFDSVTMGPLPQISRKMKNPGIKILQQLEFSLQSQNSPFEWFAGTHRGQDPDNEMGFYSSLVVADTKDGLIRGEVEVQRAFRDPNDATKSLERISFGSPFEMPYGAGFVMRGLLPSRYGMDLAEDSNSDPFMSVLKSRNFRSEETEFALIVDFDNGGPQNK